MHGIITAETKILSIRQPWAWLIVNGYKDMENRSRNSRHRGTFLVHTGLTFDIPGYDFVCKRWPHLPLPHRKTFRLGGVVGRVNLVDVVTESDSDWFFGEYGYVLDDAQTLPFFKMPGRLNFFKLSAEQLLELTKTLKQGQAT